MQYLMIQNSGTTDLAWEYRFTMPSHKMAVDYARRIACQINCNLDVFVRDVSREWDVIAYIKVKTETHAAVEPLYPLVEA